MQNYKSRKEEERAFWREFLMLYRSLPVVWKKKSEGYKNQHSRNKAYQMLVCKMKEIDSRADRNSVCTKINSFRSAYRRELKKVRDSMQSGGGTDGVYVPTLWYFHDLDFLRYEENETQETSTLDDGEWNEENNDTEADETSSQASQHQQSFTRKRTMPTGKQDVDDPQTNSEESLKNKLLVLACERLSTRPSESHMLARAWRTDYEKLSPDQQLYAKKFISDILFEGQLGTLHRNSITISDPSQPSSVKYNRGAASSSRMHADSPHVSEQTKQDHESTPDGSVSYPSLLKMEHLID
ncbi:uncharacterized protein LOC126575176 [Anopheles aquasalis]|uniref:uncharacterized protein LOC126575176 n=1 Tax=Anopheles aquasalis TaxID=42839 RepID=UPI00215B4FE1|nr:uncharacterized protein LOC126575176 [Anopheles aquasalis]